MPLMGAESGSENASRPGILFAVRDAGGIQERRSIPSRRSATATPPRLELPEQFGRYHIVKKLGEGGMGAVYLAEDTELHRQVALKVPKLASAEDIQRFQREARVAAAIDHAHVCPVHDIGCIDGIHYLTMPFIDGVPLAHLIAGRRPVPVP
jgi:serine/threonine protein kinase